MILKEFVLHVAMSWNLNPSLGSLFPLPGRAHKAASPFPFKVELNIKGDFNELTQGKKCHKCYN